MAVDTPATIAVLGAGPIGLEAALYARFLGYDVKVYEQGEVADNVMQWRHVRMFSPFAMNRSPLGLAALAAQDDSYQSPPDDALLTGGQWLDRYLLPLADTDLLAEKIHTHHRVLYVGRQRDLKTDRVGDPDRGDEGFQILTRDRDGRESLASAEAVIDTTGVFHRPNWLGAGGIPSIGESRLFDKIEHGLPDILGRQRQKFAGKHTLVVGGGYSAATNLVALAQLARQEELTRVTWLTRGPLPDGQRGPIPVISADPLSERAALTQRANDLAAGENTNVTHMADTVVQSIDFDTENDRFVVGLSAATEPRVFDYVIANVGYRGDWSISDELQVHRCYATDGPMQLAAELLGQDTKDCLAQTARGPQSLMTSEPNFYVLGAKSYGRNSKFLVSIGLKQIRDLFTIIGDREDLDLYANF